MQTDRQSGRQIVTQARRFFVKQADKQAGTQIFRTAYRQIVRKAGNQAVLGRQADI
jgi:hypothetical protein